MESDVQDEAGRQNTFTPGEGASAEESFVVNFTAEEKEQIRQMVANAESPEEIEEIERSVQRGELPKLKLKKLTIGETNEENSSNERKRSLESISIEKRNNGATIDDSKEKKTRSS